MVLMALARKWALSLAKAFSMGLRLGRAPAPVARVAFSAAGLLWV